ncbi:hypothetical protein [Marinobacterium nitratireducens]|nr:hypothetical protein [Marinobacterium nitratireducens]
MSRFEMKRKHLLASEVFGYSYEHYADRLGINPRFDRYMPQVIATLEKAVAEHWDIAKLAKRLERNEDQAADLLSAFKDAAEIVDAENAAESFRCGVRRSIQDALADGGLNSDRDIEELVTQICYRAADFAFLLDREGRSLGEYSRELRDESREWQYEDDDDQ